MSASIDLDYVPGKALIIGASRGLGLALTNAFADLNWLVTGTARASTFDHRTDTNVNWITDIDIVREGDAEKLANWLDGREPFDVVVINAGYFGKEEGLDGIDWETQLKMYTLSAVAPPFLVRALMWVKAINPGGKVILVGSEAGSVTLRHDKEGGGMYGHHGSKAAVNMVGKLLSLDLKEKDIAVGVVHPGFMRTEMTKSVGFDKFWDEGGAVTPDVAAKSLVQFITEDFSMEKTGEFWAPRGPGDIGTSEETMGKDLPTPLKLPY